MKACYQHNLENWDCCMARDLFVSPIALLVGILLVAAFFLGAWYGTYGLEYFRLKNHQ